MTPEEPLSLDLFGEGKHVYLKRLEVLQFKRFPKLVLEFSENPVVIIGANNSGKTSLQWACLLFIHAFNSRSSTSERSKRVLPVDFKEDIAELIASPAFLGPSPDFGSFVKVDEKAATLTGDVGTLSVQFTIKANGIMEIDSTDNQFLHDYPKIRFAVSTPHFLFQNPATEVTDNDEIFTSSLQNLRTLWTKLSEEFKNNLLDVMRSLFKVRSIWREKRKLKIEESSGNILEVSFVGSAMQRVFATEILFQTLLSLPDKQRIFFFEEPETFLYPSLTSAYINLIYNRSVENNIQLIVISNSSLVIDLFQDTDRRVISSISPELIPTTKQTAEVSLITASLVSLKPILLLDGDTDCNFIRLVFPDWDQKYQLISRGGRNDESMKPLLAYAKSKNLSVLWLRDREFVLPELINLQLENDMKTLGIRVLCWELPCIESYIILSNVLQHPEIEKVKHYLEELENSNQYLLGVTQGLKQLINTHGKGNIPKVNLLKYWTQALQELESENPNWRTVVEVIHGHTYFKGNILHKDVLNLHSDVKDLLQITESKVISSFM